MNMNECVNIVGGTHNIYPFKNYAKPEFIKKDVTKPPNTRAEKTVLNVTCSTRNELSTN